MKSKIILSFLLIGLIFSLSCANRAIKESMIDTSKDHYISGLDKLEKEDMAGAEADFLRSVAVEKKSPYGYSGIAYLEIKRKNYKKAYKMAKKSLKCDSTFADAYAAKGYAVCMLKKNKNWKNEAFILFKKAAETGPENQRGFYIAGECFLGMQEYESALEYYKKAAALKGAFDDKAKKRRDTVQKIVLTKPKTFKGGRVAVHDKIDRSDLCILLIYEFNLKQIIENRRPDFYSRAYARDFISNTAQYKIPPDISTAKDKWAVNEIIPLYLDDLRPFPNGFFYPDKLVTKAQLARVIQSIIVIIKNDLSVSTEYIGAKSPIRDINPDYYAFNAIMLATGKDIISWDKEKGNFEPEKTLSGTETLESLNKLSEFLNSK